VGKHADLVVLDRDISSAEDIGEVRPVLTMVGGETVYRAG
jgi:predicted amidohydrolase YtcJ